VALIKKKTSACGWKKKRDSGARYSHTVGEDGEKISKADNVKKLCTAGEKRRTTEALDAEQHTKERGMSKKT